jgi:hypothetical protein
MGQRAMVFGGTQIFNRINANWPFEEKIALNDGQDSDLG